MSLPLATLPLDLDADHPFGLTFATCSRLQCAYISDVLHVPIGMRSRNSFAHGYKGAYIVSLAESPVFGTHHIDTILQCLHSLPHPPVTIQIELAPKHKSDYDK